MSTALTESSRLQKGRWSKEEHSLFIKGIQQFGKNWKKIGELIPKRTGAQIRSHAQKYFKKIETILQQYKPTTDSCTSQSSGPIVLPFDTNSNQKSQSYFSATFLSNFTELRCQCFWDQFIQIKQKNIQQTVSQKKVGQVEVRKHMPFQIFQRDLDN